MNGYYTNRSENRRSFHNCASRSACNMTITRPKKRHSRALAADLSVPQAVCLAGAIQEIQQESHDACAAVCIRKSVPIVVTLPGETAVVLFDIAERMQGGFKYNGNTLTIPETGEYEIRFELTFTASSSVFAAFMIQADGQSMTDGVYKHMVSGTRQTVPGSITTQINGGTQLRIAVTSANAVALTIDSGSLSVRRIG